MTTTATQTKPLPKVKPCGNCGKQPEPPKWDGVTYSIECPDCVDCDVDGYNAHGAGWYNKRGTIEAWNEKQDEAVWDRAWDAAAEVIKAARAYQVVLDSMDSELRAEFKRRIKQCTHDEVVQHAPSTEGV